jgi:hypothetical protein
MRTLSVACGMAVASLTPVFALSSEPAAVPETRARREIVERHWYNGHGLTAFKDGYRAWAQSDWKTTTTEMRKARKADLRGDQPEANVKTGGAGWISPFVPSYYLAVARCRVDHCSENSDEILRLIKDADRALQDEYKRACEKQVECPAGVN